MTENVNFKELPRWVNLTWKEEAVELAKRGLSWRRIAKELGKPKSTVSDFLRVHFKHPPKQDKETRIPKILMLDIETAPSLVYVFNWFKTTVRPAQVKSHGYILTCVCKWLHSEEIYDFSLPDYDNFSKDITDDSALVADVVNLLDEADIVVAHNGDKFDMGWLKQRIAKHGLMPPTPFRTIDTYKEIKKAFCLPSNSLEAACDYFETEYQKRSNSGMPLWVRCREGDRDAFIEMREYNKYDILSLQCLYLKVRPFMANHPNLAMFYDNQSVIRCPRTGSTNVQLVKGKSSYTNVSEFDLYYCPDSNSFARGRKNKRTKQQMNNTILATR